MPTLREHESGPATRLGITGAASLGLASGAATHSPACALPFARRATLPFPADCGCSWGRPLRGAQKWSERVCKGAKRRDGHVRIDRARRMHAGCTPHPSAPAVLCVPHRSGRWRAWYQTRTHLATNFAGQASGGAGASRAAHTVCQPAQACAQGERRGERENARGREREAYEREEVGDGRRAQHGLAHRV